MEKRTTKKEKYGFSPGNRLKAIAVAWAIIGVVLSGITFGGPIAVAGGRLRVAIEGDIVNMDPAGMLHSTDWLISMQIMEGLVELDCSSIPCKSCLRLAESYEISDDAKTITFKLRRGVQFHGGYGEFTSEDVAFNFQRHLDPKVASRGRPQVQDIDRVETPDKYTVVIHLKNPTAYPLLRNLAWLTIGEIPSKKAVEKLGDKIKSHPIGTGPFYFDSWRPGEKVVLKKFADYWGPAPKIDEIEFWVLPEETVALGALGKGDLDIVPITQPGSWQVAQTVKDIYILEASTAAYHNHLYMNVGKPPMDDIKVRRALMHALDLKGIAKRLGPQVVYWPSPLPSAVFAATTEFWKYDYNLDKARQLLAEAGYPKGFELELLYTTQQFYEAMALEVANCWNKIVDVKLKQVERALMYKTIKKYEHHAAIWTRTRFSPSLYSQLYITGSPSKYMNYANPKLDEIILKGKTATTEEESRRYWREFQKFIIDEAVCAWIGDNKSQMAVRNRVKGLGPSSILPYMRLVYLRDAYFE